MLVKKELMLERRTRQAAEGKIAMQEYRDKHSEKLARIPKLRAQRLARQSINPPVPGKRKL